MFNNYLFNFINLFGSNFYDIVILFLVLLTMYGYVNFDLLRLSNIRKSLKKLNRGITELDRYDSGNIVRLDYLFDARMSSGLKNAWIAYCDDNKHTISEEKILDIKEYFNLYSIISLPARRKRAESIPGILTMTGVLGTFLGILAGLSRLDFTSEIASKAGLNSFLNIMASSFSIFIAALILSMLFQLLDRQLYHLTVSELNVFLNLVSRKIPMSNGSGSLELLILEQRSQKEVLEKMGVNISAHLSTFIGKELVPSLHKSFDDTIKTQISPSIKAMSDMLYQLSDVAYNIQRKGMQIMVDNFISRLMSTMGLEFEKLGESIKSIMEYKSKEDENINRLIENLSGNVDLQKEVNTQTVMVLETIGCYHHQAVEMNTSLAGNMESMHHFNEELREILKSDRKSVEELNNQRQALQQESSEYFGKMDEQIRRLLEDMNIQLDASFSHFNDITLMAFERLDHSLNTTIEGMSSNMKTLTDNMDDQVRDISIYAKGLSEEAGELNDRLENSVKEFGNQMKEDVEKTLGTFDDGLGEICGRLGRVISDIKDSVEDLPRIMEAMKNYKEDDRERVV